LHAGLFSFSAQEAKRLRALREDSKGCACKRSRGRARVTESSPRVTMMFRRNRPELNKPRKINALRGFLFARSACGCRRHRGVSVVGADR
ncbi:hypothetical protein QZM71_25605, partial [Burkholderia multivorans]|nr:hypothetical protein [Burkholderia multivorans]